MTPTMSVVIALLFLELLAVVTICGSSFSNASSCLGCIESEREALWRFKHRLDDPSNLLASWSRKDGDCCKWTGVVCDNLTGHVVELHLSNPYSYVYNDQFSSLADRKAYHMSQLGGKITPSLLDLKHLIYLDLSGYYNFEGNHQIPQFLGSMRNLRYLNLSLAGFIGSVPHQLGNLSSLQYLDLGQESYSGLHVENSRWLSDLTWLKHLDLTGLNLSKTFDQLLSVTNALPSLEVLKLSACEINHFPPLFVVNFSSLTTLDFSYNHFDNSLVPGWVFSLNRLVFLRLHGNLLQGPIPDGIQNLTCLKYLDLSNNIFNFSIPSWLYKLNQLEHLLLYSNNLQGKILDDLGNLTSIIELNLSDNKLEGRIPPSFGKLCKLKILVVSHLKLDQHISDVLDILSKCVSDGLVTLSSASSQLSGHLTDQLGQFKSLIGLVLRDNSISGLVPPSLGELSRLRYLDLSNNKLVGSVSEIHFANLTHLLQFSASGNSLKLEVSHDWIPPFLLEALVLRSCNLGPQFPLWLHSQKFLVCLDISNTRILDTIPGRFWKSFDQLVQLNLSHNQIHGQLPNFVQGAMLESLDLNSNNFSGPLPHLSSNVHAVDFSNNMLSGSIFNLLCYRMNESKETRILKLGENHLFGELPDCLMNWKDLEVLNLRKNNFSGKLPTSMGILSSLQSLNLRDNSLSGAIPKSLKNCTELLSLDLSQNDFIGNVPSWIGERFSKMMILNLRSNNFGNRLPIEICRLASLQILDLAYNNFSGTIPSCFGNLSAMVSSVYSEQAYINYTVDTNYTAELFLEDAVIVAKGNRIEYSTILRLARSVDLSRNRFSGEIPLEMTKLEALQSLNLSHNFFTGTIPESIGAMRSLESVDFSGNQLSGEIPQSVSHLTFLSHLNLSNNNLSGKIPLSTQLQGFDVSCFSGNELCGAPLSQSCTGDESVPGHENGEEAADDDEHEVEFWLYMGIPLGFVVGFWSVIGPLLVNRRWRDMYCRFLDHLGNKFCCVVGKCR